MNRVNVALCMTGIVEIGSMRPLISIVIPVINEEETLPALYDRLTKAAPHWHVDYEVIVIDDGSTDASAEILNAIHTEDPRWKVLHFSRNFGHQPAVSAGVESARQPGRRLRRQSPVGVVLSPQLDLLFD